MLNVWFWIMHCCIPTPTTDSNTSTGMIWVTWVPRRMPRTVRELSGMFALSGEWSPCEIWVGYTIVSLVYMSVYHERLWYNLLIHHAKLTAKYKYTKTYIRATHLVEQNPYTLTDHNIGLLNCYCIATDCHVTDHPFITSTQRGWRVKPEVDTCG